MKPDSPSAGVISTVTFDRVGHLARVPVHVAGEPHPFLVDTGIGVTVVSSAFAARTDVSPTDATFAGRRMSGQLVEAPLVRLPSLRLGDYRVDDHVAGVADLGSDFAGILGPGFFEGYGITIDPDLMTLTVEPAPTAPVDGVVVPLDVRRDGRSLEPFAQLVLPSGRSIWVEVDTGSATLILDTRFMADCGLSPDDPSMETTTGTDETGYQWTRHDATVDGAVHLDAAPQTAHEAPRVMFQDIIHDGLIGTEYLERFRVTYDVSGGRLIMSPRARHSPR